jgi:hypothetical protein
MARRPSGGVAERQQQPVDLLPSKEAVHRLPDTVMEEEPPVELLSDKNKNVAKKRRKSGGGEQQQQNQPAVSFARDPKELLLLKAGRQADARKKIKGRKATPNPAAFARKEPSSYPFFQNPRRPIVPAVESSWGNSKLSPGLFPYVESATGSGQPNALRPSGIPPPSGLATGGCHRATPSVAATVVQPRVISSFKSTEYLDKYRDGGGKGEAATKDVSSCPCCGEVVAPGAVSTVEGSNGQRYHLDCFACGICGRAVDARGKLDDCMFLMRVPHHRRCVGERAGEVVGRRRGKGFERRGGGGGGGQYPQQRRTHHPHPNPSPPDAPSSLPKPRAAVTLEPQPPPRTQKALARELSSFFSARKKSSNVVVPATGGISEESCTACGKALDEMEAAVVVASGPNVGRFHGACMRCRGCGLEISGTAARWYEWDGRGLMVLLCR